MECSVIYLPTNGRIVNLVRSPTQNIRLHSAPYALNKQSPQACTAPKDNLFPRTCAQLLILSLEARKLRARVVLHTILVMYSSDAPQSLQKTRWGCYLVWDGSQNISLTMDVIAMAWSSECGPCAILLWNQHLG